MTASWPQPAGSRGDITAILCLWALFYALAPLVEEPWLVEKYGDSYRDYAKRTARFLPTWPG